MVVSRFVGGEATKQGIDIGGSNGEAVRAAADGVVVYSGAGLVGYGELIIVKHNEQWLSAYGHNRKRRRLTRYNGKPVDPLLYLPPK
ncbi:Murein hydrolase activator NlpD [Xanthomonas sacchari]|nr:Murein hydrolase activator NlpD [Xanthomonas sacchari]